MHVVIGISHTIGSSLVYPISAMCFFTFGLLGLFPPVEALGDISLVSGFWF